MWAETARPDPSVLLQVIGLAVGLFGRWRPAPLEARPSGPLSGPLPAPHLCRDGGERREGERERGNEG